MQSKNAKKAVRYLFVAFKGFCGKICGHVCLIHSLNFSLKTLKINQRYFRTSLYFAILESS
ncbi:hypothetical protein [Helicobacter bilis]|uniref:hypothetical protein n=1 Tax=Helicobacter bilis TaxID=37372 RepID=UPI0013158616|nr:hypothetical protein [Helicobacter bilis]